MIRRVLRRVETRKALWLRERSDAASSNRSPVTSAEKHRQQLPFPGSRWRIGDQEWALLSRRGRGVPAYELATKPALEGANRQVRAALWARGQHGMVTVCHINAGALARSVADTLGQMEEFELAGADSLMRNAPLPRDSAHLEQWAGVRLSSKASSRPTAGFVASVTAHGVQG